MWRKLVDTLKDIRFSKRSRGSPAPDLRRDFEIGSWKAVVHQRRYGSSTRHDRRPDEPFPSANSNLLLFPIFDSDKSDRSR